MLLVRALSIGCQVREAEPELFLEVFQDERISSWCARPEIAPVISCADLERIAANLPADELLPARPGLSRLEGQFRPGRYRYSAGEDSASIVVRLMAESRAHRGSVSAPTTSGLTPYEEWILASIVEKESVNNRDYDRVASVFLNRLRNRQTLGSCPTVEYALGFHRPFLLFRDLELDSPYNVYKRRGLPPTPIAFFSDDALAAVRNAPDTDLLFFVYDWTLSELTFTSSYPEHRRNAEVARANFVAMYGRESMYRKYEGLFYEWPPPDPVAPDTAQEN